MIGAVFALALLAAPAASEQCSVIIPHPSGSGFTHQPAVGYSIVDATPPAALPQGFADVQTIACVRDALVITDNDLHIVLDLDVPVMIAAEGVVGSLEAPDGALAFRLIRGELSGPQAATVQAALDRGRAQGRGGAD